jgi:hypothetical protein
MNEHDYQAWRQAHAGHDVAEYITAAWCETCQVAVDLPRPAWLGWSR